MSIDWSKPIETVPCDRNPVAVPAEVEIEEDGSVSGVKILGMWVDGDGSIEGRDGWHWGVDPDTGEFLALQGKVRNREIPTRTIPVTGHPIDQFRHMIVDMAYRCAGAVQTEPGVFQMQDAEGNVIGSVSFAEMVR